MDNLDNYKITLGSNSPRRKELLSGLGLQYEVKVIPDIDESYPVDLQGEEIPLYIAKAKADAYVSGLDDNEIVITADTIVWLDSKVLGKPEDGLRAKQMLKELSGKTHQVITGVAITGKTFQRSFTAVTEVKFAELAEDEISYYVDQFAPFDKAGAYGIQEWIGFVGVEWIQGSYFNVMGLPVQKLYRELLRIQ